MTRAKKDKETRRQGEGGVLAQLVSLSPHLLVFLTFQLTRLHLRPEF